MGQWHCAIDGKQYGPVDEQTLQSWINEGRLKLTDLIWQEGMAEWQPVSSFPQFSAPVGGVPTMINPEVQEAGRFVPAPTGGTNGTTPVLEITASAHNALKGRWGLPIGFCVLLTLLVWFITAIPDLVVKIAYPNTNTPPRIMHTPNANINAPDTIMHTPSIAPNTPQTIATIAENLISLFIGGAIAFGYTVFFLTFIRRGQPRLGNMFDGFKIYGTTLAAHLLMVLYILLWGLLLIIPGIIAALAYSQTFFIIADNPDIRAGEAITRSKKMMDGHKWRLFGMQMWITLLSLLCVFTLFIGLFWLIPYAYASYAKFYEDLQPPLNLGAIA